MRRISLELDDADAEWLEARIDDSKPTLEEVAKAKLAEYAKEIRPSSQRSSCECGRLDQISSEANSSIIFDPMVNEFGLQRDTAYGKATYVIRYCLWCGGRAPTSKRDQLFAKLDYEETRRLTVLCAGIKTFKDAMDRFGHPETDQADGLVKIKPTADGADEYTSHRVIVYENLSKTANVRVTQQLGEVVSVSFVGKYVGSPAR